MASDEKYVPGKGLDRGANSRLRARQAEQNGAETRSVHAELPGKDDSAQTDFLLGNGAKKVARCSKCTRPLDNAAVEAKVFVCSRCENPGGRSISAASGGYGDADERSWRPRGEWQSDTGRGGWTSQGDSRWKDGGWSGWNDSRWGHGWSKSGW
eukprot:s198_g12.t1